LNYIGSKLSLLKFLEDSIVQVVDKDSKIFCDLFAGTGIVGSYFKKKGYSVISNDIQYYSYVLNKQYIGNHQPLNFLGLISEIPKLSKAEPAEKLDITCEYLSDLKGVEGFIYNNYCVGGTRGKEYERQYFSDENGQRCDAIRQQIEAWKNESKINDDEYFFLLASLIESIDKYANTASVYGAFLKQLKKSAQKTLVLKPALMILNDRDHQVFNEDINTVINSVEGDILYLDPPYNQRQYATNYHLLETIAKYDNPQLYGKTGLRDYKKEKSLYCSRQNVKKAFQDLIKNAKSKYIFLSYNNEGLMTMEDIKEIMQTRGQYGFFTKEYARFKADKDVNRDFSANKTLEYLHYVSCEN